MKEPLLVKFLKRAFPHRFFVAKLSNVPIFKGVIDHMLFDGDNMIYLPKDQVVQMDQPLDNLGEMVLPSQVVEHFIEKANYHWIMDWCICRKSTKCEDYPIELGCLFLIIIQKCFKDHARYDLTDGICGSDHVELDMLELSFSSQARPRVEERLSPGPSSAEKCFPSTSCQFSSQTTGFSYCYCSCFLLLSSSTRNASSP